MSTPQEVIARLQNTIDGKKALAKDILRQIQLETNPQSLYLLNAQLQFLEANVRELSAIQADLAQTDEPAPTHTVTVASDPTETVVSETEVTLQPVDETPTIEETAPITAPTTKRTRKTTK